MQENKQATITMINTWIESKKSELDPIKNAVIVSVKNSLDYNKMRFEKLSATENLIIVPINDGFKSAVNINKKTINNLLLIINETGNIRKGNIVQFIPKAGTFLNELPKNTFNKFYNSGKIESDGKFSFLNLNDKILYQMDYNDGKLSAYGEKQIHQDASVANLCTEWYLVTTIYYGNGTVAVAEEYLYTTCSSIENELDDQTPGGGGGGIPEEETSMAEKSWSWDIVVNTSGLWKVVSIEKFNGVKKASSPGGGYFTSSVHLADGVIINIPQMAYQWTRTSVIISHNGSTAKSTVSGWLKDPTHQFQDVEITPHESSFTFAQVYP